MPWKLSGELIAPVAPASPRAKPRWGQELMPWKLPGELKAPVASEGPRAKPSGGLDLLCFDTLAKPRGWLDL